MKRFGILLIIIFAASYLSNAQTIEIVRTDVDSSRQGIVTSTYLFGFDIYAKDIESCNGVAFELRYNQTEYVKFSGWQNGDFGVFGNAQVVEGKSQDNKGRIIIGTGTGIPLGNLGIDNPKVIHLEFSVTQSAPHFSFITFEFVQPKATIFEDGLGQKIDLETEPETFRIHSFIDVWPGDANNDGSVTFDDYNQINLYMGMGSATKNFRSFKRPQASTIWKPQRVLAWDSADVSYADCDGNGDITSTDHLIVTYNIDKTRSAGGVINSVPEQQEREFPEDALFIPVYAYSNEQYIGAAGDIFLNTDKDDYLGIKPGEILNNPYIADKFDDNTKNLTVSVSATDDKSISDNGVLFYIVLKSDANITHHEVTELNAITSYGSIFELNNLTSVNESENKIFISNDLIKLPAEYSKFNVKISDIYGNVIYNQTNTDLITLKDFQSGTYFLNVFTPEKVITQKFIIVK